MYLNSINFPNQLLDAIRDNKLVIFAGAGTSMGKPTCLPNFNNLAKEIAEDTGHNIKKNEPCEVFLGTLKARKIDVNGIAANILSGACLKHNPLHEAIVDLFVNPEEVKIVTTNYDQMFEQVLEEKSAKPPIYNSPALPLGDDFSGIVHVHGNVDNPKYMVVTDEDFGKAYLTEGYAARFLVKLFESYTVLFIGYSYNDTIMRYLTRAMSRQHSANRYILTDDTKSDWDALGLTLISYPKRSTTVMRVGLTKLGQYTKKGLLDWKNQFIEIADAPPKDLTIETEIDYCLEDATRSKVLSSCVHGAEWLELLDKKGVFSCCFSKKAYMDDNSKVWANWLCDNFIGSDDNSLKTLFTKHENSFNDYFSEMVFKKLINGKKQLSDKCFKEYITLFDSYLVDSWIILNCIEIAKEKRLYHLSLHLFEKLFIFSIKLEKDPFPFSKDYVKPKHVMIGDYYHVNRAWELINGVVLPSYATELLAFVRRIIEELHYMYSEMGEKSRGKEPWFMSLLDVEDRVKEYSRNPLHILVQVFLRAIKELGENNYSKSCLIDNMSSKSILLRKISLRAIRESACLNDNEKIDLLCDASLIWFSEGKEQVFLLAQDVFKKVSTEKQNRLLTIIFEGPNEFEKRIGQYKIYNWCVWLQKTNPQNEIIESVIKKIESKYNFTPREHPERIIVESDVVSLDGESPVTIQEMLEMPIEKLVFLLLNYNEEPFNGPTRWELMNTFTLCVRNNMIWAQKVVDYLYNNRIKNVEIWDCLFRGFEEAEQTICETVSLLNMLSKIVDMLHDVQGLAHYLLKALQREEMKQLFDKNEQMLFELSLKLWNMRATKKPETMRLIDKTLNTTTGIVLMCWIHMISYSCKKEIPILYKSKLEEALQLKTWEREVAVCVLAGHFNFLCYRDSVWCVNHFEPMLTGNSKKAFCNAWEGIVFFSRRINKDTADITAPIYFKAVKNINWLKDEVKRGFIELFLTLLIFVIERPTYKYIPEFYKYASKEDRKQFVAAIGYRLRALDTESRKKWWNNWLKHFLVNRGKNKPVELEEAECSALFMLLPRLDFAIDESIDILCNGRLPSFLDHMFWYEINEHQFARDHSQSVAKLLIKLLNSLKELNYAEEQIIQIVASLQGLKEKDKKQLQEALLMHNICLSLK